jgi:hypothetical protein
VLVQGFLLSYLKGLVWKQGLLIELDVLYSTIRSSGGVDLVSSLNASLKPYKLSELLRHKTLECDQVDKWHRASCTLTSYTFIHETFTLPASDYSSELNISTYSVFKVNQKATKHIASMICGIAHNGFSCLEIMRHSPRVHECM